MLPKRCGGRSARCRRRWRRARRSWRCCTWRLNLLFIYSTPLEAMKGVIAIGALSASNLFGPGVAGVFSALMALSIVSTVNAEVTIGPRVYYAMAKNRAFFNAAAQVHPRLHTPVVGDSEPGALRHADDAHAVPRAADVHRDEPDAVHGAFGGVAVHIPAQPARLAEAARGGFRVIR